MNKSLITGIISMVIGLSAGWFIFHPATNQNAATERKILYYLDPMNPQITSPTPKKSTDGMDYVPVYGDDSEDATHKKIAYYKDPMHPWYTADKPGKAPDCGMDLVPVYEGESDLKGIKIDPVTVQNMGVRTEPVTKRRLKKTIRTTGKIDYNESKVYTVNTKIMGWIEKLHISYTGQPVRKGQPLLDIYSPELVTTQQEYLQAIRYRARLAGSDIEEAIKGTEELVQSTKRRLIYWDIPESEIRALEEQGIPQKTMTILSPVDGVVIDKMIWQGQNVMPGMTLYKIADLSTLWILVDIYEYELSWVEIGQKAEVELAYLPGKSFSGTVTYIYPYLDAETRTAKVRIQVTNTPNFEFKPEMYVTVKLISPVLVDAVGVPDQAIIRSGERNVVVISLGGGYFDPREVKLGVSADGYVQIIEGVHAGEEIVTSSQFLIDSESNLKAAINAMRGHEGMDMSKTMEEPKDSDEIREQPGEVTSPVKPDDHKDHTMSILDDTSKNSRQGLVTDKENNDVPVQPAGDNQNKKIYTCVMHPEIRSEKPGNCPKCGMKLILLPSESDKPEHNH
jgi:RND family efflux transporter MFP subunit